MAFQFVTNKQTNKPSGTPTVEIIDQAISQCFAFKTKNERRNSPRSSSDTLSLLHLAHVSAAVLVVGRAVGGSVGDAVLVVFAVGVDSRAILTRRASLFGQPLALHVSLDPEVREEHEEEGSINPDEVAKDGVLVVAAVQEIILGSVEGNKDELDLSGGNWKLAKHLL